MTCYPLQYTLALLVATTVGCSKTDSTTRAIDTWAIQQAATTLTIQSGSKPLTIDAWPTGLTVPEPIRLYRDGQNLVLVLSDEQNRRETGFYVHTTYSSDRPINSTEWKFQALDNGVWRYKKKLANH
jgi:hypothetical protein